jgi:hypothetical protein
MIAVVEQKKDDLADLCRRFKVERLELFGSAATGSFQSGSSDLDFIVRFSAASAGSYLDAILILRKRSNNFSSGLWIC